jgi:hypothetical protein
MGKRIHQHWPKSPSKLDSQLVLGGRTSILQSLITIIEADNIIIRVKQSFEQVNTH